MATKNLLLNSAAGLFVTISTLAIGIVLKITLARLLSPAHLGLLISGQTLFGMGVFLGSLGLSDAVARFVGLSWKRSVPDTMATVGRGVRLGALSGTLLCLVMLLLAKVIAKYIGHDPDYVGIVCLFALGIPFKIAADLLGAACQGKGELYYKLLVVELIPALAYLLGLEILNLTGRATLTRVVLVYILPMIATPLLFLRAFPLRKLAQFNDNGTSYREVLSYSGPLLASGVVAWPLTLVPVVICGVTSAAEVSYYSLAISLASFIYLGVSVTEAAGLSVWSSYLGMGETRLLREDYRLVTRWSLVMGSVAFAALLLQAPAIVTLLFGAKYGKLATIVPLASAISFFGLLSGPTESLLKAYGETKFILITRIASGCIVLVLLYPFLIWWGVWGAMIVYGLTIGTGMIMYSMRLYKRDRIHPIDRHFLMTLAAIGVAIVVAGIFSLKLNTVFGLPGKIAWTTGIYCSVLSLLLVSLRAIDPRDLRILAGAVKRGGEKMRGLIQVFAK